jgi:hypothetical protein
MSVERQTFSTKLRIGKWLGFILGTMAALADQQITATTIYARCPVRSDLFVISVGAVCAAIGMIGAFISWRTRQELPSEESASASLRTDRFVATLSAVFALFCVLFILFATVAGLILRCER